MVVFMKFEPLMRLSVEGQDSSWILWHWRTDIRESHYMWKDLEISSLYLSALGTTFLYHCAGGAGQLRCQNLKEGWNTSASLGYPQGQYLLCTGPRSSFCCSCCCTAAWLGYIWFSSLEESWVLRHKEFEGLMEATSQTSWPTDVLLLVPSHLCNFVLDRVGTACTGDLSCQQQ